jgi:hypothetical protein
MTNVPSPLTVVKMYVSNLTGFLSFLLVINKHIIEKYVITLLVKSLGHDILVD